MTPFLEYHNSTECYDFLWKLEAFPPLPKDDILCTVDAVCLYPNIPYNGGLLAMRKALDARDNKIIPANFFIELVEYVFTSLNITLLSANISAWLPLELHYVRVTN